MPKRFQVTFCRNHRIYGNSMVFTPNVIVEPGEATGDTFHPESTVPTIKPRKWYEQEDKDEKA